MSKPSNTARIKREKVILGKTSLEELVELNKLAGAMGMVACIGVLPKGTLFKSQTLEEDIPYYLILSDNIITPSPEGVCLSKEDTLKRIIELGKHSGK